MKKILAVLAVMVFAAGAYAQETVNYTWTAPTTGTAVDHYVVEHSEDGGDWVVVEGNQTTNSYQLVAEYNVEHRIRVAGVDTQGRQGTWSVPSDPYTPDLGVPGAPGQPVRVF